MRSPNAQHGYRAIKCKLSNEHDPKDMIMSPNTAVKRSPIVEWIVFQKSNTAKINLETSLALNTIDGKNVFSIAAWQLLVAACFLTNQIKRRPPTNAYSKTVNE